MKARSNNTWTAKYKEIGVAFNPHQKWRENLVNLKSTKIENDNSLKYPTQDQLVSDSREDFRDCKDRTIFKKVLPQYPEKI